MNPIRLVIVIPCFSLDDFPDNLDEPMASDFLNAWVASWHPSVLHYCRSLPEWKRSDSSSLDLDRAVVVVPQVSAVRVDSPLRERISLSNVLVNSQGESRENLAKAILTSAIQLQQDADQPAIPTRQNPSENSGGNPNESPSEASSNGTGQPSQEAPSLLANEEVVLDFYALAFAYLQIQMLTRKIRYSSNLNQPLFEEQLQKGTDAAIAGDFDTCQQWLQSCFDQLSQEREHYYSQSAYLLDVCLLAETTLGTKLHGTLDSDHPIHLLADAQLLERVMQSNQATFERIQALQQDERLCLLGGLGRPSLPMRWMTPQSLDREIAHGKRCYESLGLQSPKVYASFQPGFLPDLGSLLKRHGYEGALVIDWLQDAYPKGSQNKITWEAADGSGLDAIANGVLDANSSNHLLTLGARLASQFDYHQTPTLLMAHWPMRTCQAFADLLRVTKRTPALGIWCNANEYFATTQRPYHQQRLAPEKFLPPITLDDLWRTHPLQAYWRHSIELDSAFQIQMLAEQVRAYLQPKALESSVVTDGDRDPSYDALQRQLLRGLEEADGPDTLQFEASAAQDSERLEAFRQASQHALQKVLPRVSKSTNSSPVGEPAWLLINSFLGPRRVFLEGVSGTYQEDREKRLYAAETDGRVSDVVVDVPPCGFVRISPTPAARMSRAKPIASPSGVLGNEFLECHIDPKSSRLSGLYIANRRGNRMSGMLALRMKGADSKSLVYTESHAQKFHIPKNHSVCGRLAFEGTFRLEREVIGRFSMTFTLWRGSRLLDITLQSLEIESAWKERVQYAAWRTAWPNESAILHAWPQGLRQTVTQRRFYSPVLVEIDEAEHKSHLVTAGIPFHQKVETRFLDTLIDHRDWHGPQRIGLGIDLPRPYQNALEWLDPVSPLADPFPPISAGAFAWFFQCASPHVQIELVRNVLGADGKCTGVWVMLSETNNQSVSVRLECFRSLKQADRINATGASLGVVESHDDALKLTLRANEQVLLHVQWS